MGIIDEAIAKSKEMVTQNQTSRLKNFVNKINQFNNRLYKLAGLAVLSLIIGLTSMAVINSAGKSANIYEQTAGLSSGIFISGNDETEDTTDNSETMTGKGNRKKVAATNKVTTNITDTDEDDDYGDDETTPPVDPPAGPPVKGTPTISIILNTPVASLEFSADLEVEI